MEDLEQKLRVLLDNIAKEHNYNNAETSIEEISSGGANFTSKLFKAVIKSPNKEDLRLFAKAAFVGKQLREDLQLKLFNTEDFVYTKLFKIYRNIENEYGLTADQRINIAECYGSNPTVMDEMLVLEDLNAQGYSDYDRSQSISWEYAASAIKELVKLHALSFAFNKKYPKEYEECMNTLRVHFDPVKINAMFCGPIDNALQNVTPKHKEVMQRYTDSFMRKRMVEFYLPVLKPHICHMDFKPSNLMSKNRQDGTVEIKVVDLQTMHGSCPVVDLLYFIFTGSDETFRAQYYDKLIEYYYEQLTAAMRRLSLNPDETYSRADFDHELKEKLPFGLSLAIFALPIVTVSAENAPKIESMDLSSFSNQNTSNLYAERLNGIVNDYIKWGILK